jgi:preprotein translocase subunit SecF
MGAFTQAKPVPHVVTGDRDAVAAAMRRAYADGRLTAITEGKVLPGDRVRITAHLREPAADQSRWERVRPWLVGTLRVAAVLAAVAAVAGLVWLVVLAVMWVVALVAAVIAWIHAHLLGIAFGVVALVVFVLACLSSGGGCGGMHCGGCRG